MSKNTSIILQLIGDLVIPLLGYFLWDWSLFFILLFYLLENLFNVFFRIETIQEIKKLVLRKDQVREKKTLIKSLFLWLVECVLIHIFILVIEPKQSFSEEWIHFFMYEDLGIPQGIVLLPLLYLSSRMKMKQDVMVFVKNMKSLDDLEKLVLNFNHSFIATVIWGFLISINYFFHIHEIVNLLIVLLLIIVRSLKAK